MSSRTSGSSSVTREIEELDLSPYASVAKEVIREAVALGWIARPVKGGQGMLLISAVDSSVTITIPGNNTNLRRSRVESMAGKLVRYADPMRRAVTSAAISTARDGDPAVTLDKDNPLLVTPGDEGYDKIQSQYKPEPEPDVFITSEKPWLARRGTSERNAEVYESKTTVERKWSDGSVDYKCTVCDFTDPAPRRVAQHYRNSSKDSHPMVERPTEVMRADPYVPAARSVTAAQRAERLAKELAKATETIGLPPQEGTDEWLLAVAREVINKRDERRDAEGEHEPEPLTPEQVLERIRGLVDDGSYLRRLERERELEDRLALIEAEAQECKLRAEEAENERDHIRSEWQTVIGLLQQSPYAGGVQGDGS